MKKYKEFYDFMSEYTVFFENAEAQEEEKLNALLSNDIKRIEHALNEHQTTVKKIENYEKQREEYLKKDGIENKSFREIIDSCEGNEKIELQKLYDRFELAIHNVSDFNKLSMKIADINIKLTEAQDMVTEAKCYDTQGVAKDNKNANLLDKKA